MRTLKKYIFKLISIALLHILVLAYRVFDVVIMHMTEF